MPMKLFITNFNSGFSNHMSSAKPSSDLSPLASENINLRDLTQTQKRPNYKYLARVRRLFIECGSNIPHDLPILSCCWHNF